MILTHATVQNLDGGQQVSDPEQGMVMQAMVQPNRLAACAPLPMSGLATTLSLSSGYKNPKVMKLPSLFCLVSKTPR
jgi:hypothetical protein